MTTPERKNLIDWVRKNKGAHAARILEQFRAALQKNNLRLHYHI